MSYAVLPSVWGLANNLERPYTVDQFLKGLYESPKFVAGPANGDFQPATRSEHKKRLPPTPACICKHWPSANGG